jgi:hypothetical protein
MELRAPEDGDVYTILRYLALVERRAGAAELAMVEEESVALCFAADGRRAAALRTGGARVMSAGGAAAEIV